MTYKIIAYCIFVFGHLSYDFIVKNYSSYALKNIVFFSLIYIPFILLLIQDFFNAGKKEKIIFFGFIGFVSLRLTINLVCFDCSETEYKNTVNNYILDLISWIWIFAITGIYSWGKLSKRGTSIRSLR